MTRGKAADRQDAGASTARRELVESELYEQAARLFAQKGFAGTSFSDIAAAMGVSRQALYYYVKNKDDLIEKLVQEMIDITRSLSERFVADASVPPADRLRALLRGLALEVAERPHRHRLIAQSESVLTGELAEVHTAQRRRFTRDVIAVIEEGQRTGVFRPVDPRAAALTVLGMCNWIAWWFHGDSASAYETAEQVADTALRGLLGPQQQGTPGDPHAAIATIKDNLRTLESALDRRQE
ncbi:TetR/AcrR family transcriptional regulator [Pseudonocardia endophytica]|uniref:TetR family transcriptional regulator n=1 Tax=Pseudonocardia endophytica TaxID=401976 RepID=A0A4R1HQH4_PSEEN|nr:TetR/AcrR family transcriptional regulator [Pseudonocardia endophytica]TCK22009.1 TetR family transcriptional regulator [Pseudonocardia endophytica]